MILRKKLTNWRVFKGLAVFVLSVAILCNFATITSLAYNGAAPYSISKKVLGDGIRLRSEPETGTILELMYKNEIFWVDQRNLSDRQRMDAWFAGSDK
jgi:hypothetical protein